MLPRPGQMPLSHASALKLPSTGAAAVGALSGQTAAEIFSLAIFPVALADWRRPVRAGATHEVREVTRTAESRKNQRLVVAGHHRSCRSEGNGLRQRSGASRVLDSDELLEKM